MLRPLILVPAYGRKYATAEEAIADYEAGKDFRIDGTSTYCSIRDFKDEQVNIKIAPGLYCVSLS